jgi:hypothetical protein
MHARRTLSRAVINIRRQFGLRYLNALLKRSAMARDRDGLLSEKADDEDAAMVTYNSEVESDAESVGDIQEDDRDILNETAEHEKLLRKPTRFEKARSAFGLRESIHDGASSSKPKRMRKKGIETPDKMEGGFRDTSFESSFDMQDPKWDKKTERKSHCGRLTMIYLTIISLFVGFLFGAYKASMSRKHISPSEVKPKVTYNNGTHTFRPTTILISLDGFRADFLNRKITPALSAFIASGVSPKYMLPSFPSVTFPNHFTLVTGLYPESHGVVSNQFWDPGFEEEFWYTNIKVSVSSLQDVVGCSETTSPKVSFVIPTPY